MSHKIMNKYGIEMSSKLLRNYFDKLINDHFKLLPLAEGLDFKTKEKKYSDEQSRKMFSEYLENYIYELCGGYFIFDENEQFVILLSNLEAMKIIDPISQHKQLKRLVMKSIDICKKLKEGVDEA